MFILKSEFKKPYYAVIFTSILSENTATYDQTSDRMVELVEKQNGFLGFDSVRNGLGITISYWKDLESIKHWKKQIEHITAQKKGKDTWYKNYSVGICKVVDEYRSF